MMKIRRKLRGNMRGKKKRKTFGSETQRKWLAGEREVVEIKMGNRATCLGKGRRNMGFREDALVCRRMGRKDKSVPQGSS